MQLPLSGGLAEDVSDFSVLSKRIDWHVPLIVLPLGNVLRIKRAGENILWPIVSVCLPTDSGQSWNVIQFDSCRADGMHCDGSWDVYVSRQGPSVGFQSVYQQVSVWWVGVFCIHLGSNPKYELVIFNVILVWPSVQLISKTSRKADHNLEIPKIL